MASVFDVAKYILTQQSPMPTMKLQKLVYYAQAWHLVWSHQPLFRERIEAWAYGPVCTTLYGFHRGQFELANDTFRWGDIQNLSDDQRDSIDKVLNFYGDKNSQWLSDLTHMEAPWMDARQGIADGEASEQVIPLSAMAKYYASLS